MQLILASTSKYRKLLLTNAGFSVLCEAPDYEETAIPGMHPLDLISAHSRGKAQSVAQRHPEAIVIGSDQGLVLGNRLFGKPGTVEAACAQLRLLRGNEAILATGLAVMHAGRVLEALDRAVLRFRADLTDAAIEAYVRAEMPLDCAGSFKIESRGPRLFSAIECDDPTAIQGLPMMRLTAFVHEFWPECDLAFA